MSKELFAHWAKRAGFRILEQKVLSWGGGEDFAPEIDSLTLLEKPKDGA
jgi:hypothetical protein